MVSPVPVLPSPNLHSNVSGSPSGSEDPAALNVTDSPDFTVPLGVMDMVAVGGLLLLSRSVQPANMEERSTKEIKQASSRGLAMRRALRSEKSILRLFGCPEIQFALSIALQEVLLVPSKGLCDSSE